MAGLFGWASGSSRGGAAANNAAGPWHPSQDGGGSTQPPAARRRHVDPALMGVPLAPRRSRTPPGDEFDLMDDEVRIVLSSNRNGQKEEVRARLTWGTYLRALLQEPQPIVFPFGTPEAHRSMAIFFDDKDRWDAHKVHLHDNPELLLELLEYSAGLQSIDVFTDACAIFGELFATFAGANALPWPLDSTASIAKCGRMIREKFKLHGGEEMERPQKLRELQRYFSADANMEQSMDDLTHSVDHAALRRRHQNATNETDFTHTLDKFDPFRQREWQADEEADTCPSCRKPFVSGYSNFLSGVYASHCRVCGLRKCVGCTDFKVDKSIARLSKPGGPEEPQMRKACVDCYRLARNMQRHAFLGQVFVFAGLDIVQISMLRTVNASWSMTAELILHGLRAAIYEFNTVGTVGGTSNGGGGTPPPGVRTALDHVPMKSVQSTSDIPTTSHTLRNIASSSHQTNSGGGSVGSDPAAAARQAAAVNASVRRLYRSSARLFDGHPEHVILLFLYLDWSEPTDVATALGVLKRTASIIASHQRGGHGSRAAANSDRQNSASSYSHWHLLCSRSCSSMSRAFFGMRMLEALKRAPRDNAHAEEALHVVTNELLKVRHDTPTKAAIVPLLLDMFQHRTTHQPAWDVLAYFAKENPCIALQAICDYRSRAGDSSFYEARHFTEHMEESVIQGASSPNAASLFSNTPRPTPTPAAQPSPPEAQKNPSPPREQGVYQEHKFTFTGRFLEALEECMQALQKRGGSVDEDTVRKALVSALTNCGLLNVIGGGASSSAAAAGGDAISIAPMMYPFDRSITIVAVQLSGIRVMSSKVRPVMIPLVDAAGVVHRVLWKGESLRQDYVVCLCGMRALRILFDKREILDPTMIPSYHVLPLSLTSGLIECVNNATSVQEIIAEGASRGETNALLAYLETLHNPNIVSQHFLLSAKFFILFNYLLKLRDRHRDNVMLTSEGSIFHIDFGMILNEKTVAESVTSSYVRFDGDLERCIAHYMGRQRTDHRATSAAEPAAGAGSRHKVQRGSAAPAPPTGSSTATDTDAARVTAFLQEVADWFCMIRPHAHDVYLLLRHLSSAKRAAANASASGAASHHHHGTTTSLVFVGVSLAGNPLYDPRNEAEDDLEMQGILEDTFLRHVGEATARQEFVRRILDSRGKERVKDWTYETKKKTSSWLVDIGSRMMSMMPQR